MGGCLQRTQKVWDLASPAWRLFRFLFLCIFFLVGKGEVFFNSRSSICRFLLVAGRKSELSISNDHGLPLAMDPRRRICVTLEVATGVGWEYRIELMGVENRGGHENGRVVGGFSDLVEVRIDQCRESRGRPWKRQSDV